jgi:glycosyltransferase involved in cell wall biosynthesis
MHGAQMNYAIGLASHDWVLCMDSDEILDNDVVAAILALKAGRSLTRPAPGVCRATGLCWATGATIYPVSSPDFPVRSLTASRRGLTIGRWMTRWSDTQLRQNAGLVRHDTFYSLHEVFNKLNSYTTRLVKYQQIKPSLTRGSSAPLAL